MDSQKAAIGQVYAYVLGGYIRLEIIDWNPQAEIRDVGKDAVGVNHGNVEVPFHCPLAEPDMKKALAKHFRNFGMEMLDARKLLSGPDQQATAQRD